MRLIIHFCFLVVIVFPIAAVENSLFESFFGEQKYVITELELINNSGEHLILASVYATEKSDLITKGVVYCTNGSTVEVYAFILGSYIVAPNWKTLINASESPGKFWGWRIFEYRDNATGKPLGLSVIYYADEGDRVTDQIDIRWNQKTNKFGVLLVDKSQW